MPTARTPLGPRRPPRKRARLEVDERREQLLAIGLEAFAKTPYDLVAIDDVARAANVSKGLLYHYFPNKRAFYAAIIECAAAQLLRLTETDPKARPVDRLRQGLEAYLNFVQVHAGTYVALMQGGIGSDPAVATIVEWTRKVFLDRLLTGSNAQESAASMVRVAVRGWLGYVEATSLYWLQHRGSRPEVLRDHLMDVLLFALGRAQERLARS